MRSVLTILSVCGSAASAQLAFVEATSDLGLDGNRTGHCCFVDLNSDGRPDAVLGRNRVFLNVEDADSPRGVRFVEVEQNGLPERRRGDIAVFADLDNDGVRDCVWTRYLDVNADDYEPPTSGPPRTAWIRGNGDGTFGSPVGSWDVVAPAPPAPTAAIAVGDIDLDGRLDLYLGNWYAKYGSGLDGVPNDLIRNHITPSTRLWGRVPSTVDGNDFDEVVDAGGRPTYGVVLVDLIGDGSPSRLDLNYGRRWNRLWLRTLVYEGDGDIATFRGAEWRDAAPTYGIDGDDIRHGRHPEWLRERAKADPRFDRADEKPFRSNGNTFDAAVGDIDNDGDFDLFLAEITHGWAGESSDRSRFLVNEQIVRDLAEPWVTHTRFVYKPGLSVDRAPADPTIQSWNQGDIYAELADFDLDGRLDLLLCSSDYPDNQRLRIYRQQADGTFDDITSWIGIDHVGAGQPSLADIDHDGDLDIMVGQSFNRLRADQRAGRSPEVRVYLNQAADRALGSHLTVRLEGDPARGASRDALGAIVRVTATIDGRSVTQSRQLIGIGGHQGKQMDFVAHFGLGDAAVAERVEIDWPSAERLVTVLEAVEAGTHTVRLADTD